MSYSSFEPSATKLVAEHLANGLFALTTGTGISSGPRELDRRDRSFVHAPSLKMRQFKSSGFGVRLQLNGFEIPDDFTLLFAPNEPARSGNHKKLFGA